VVLGGPPVTGIVAVDVDANWALLLLVTTILLLAAPKARRRYL